MYSLKISHKKKNKYSKKWDNADLHTEIPFLFFALFSKRKPFLFLIIFRLSTLCSDVFLLNKTKLNTKKRKKVLLRTKIVIENKQNEEEEK